MNELRNRILLDDLKRRENAKPRQLLQWDYWWRGFIVGAECGIILSSIILWMI